MNDSKMSREKRLAAALRANLQRRKQGARQRSAHESEDPTDGAESGGEPADLTSRGGKS